MKVDERALKAAMRKMGIQSQDIPATEVIIKTDNKEITITDPQVTKVNMMGQDTFQIIGRVSEREIQATTNISEEDIETVMQQANTDRNTAKKALEETKGDLAAAILGLK